MQLILTPELILDAYREGLFPMSYGADSLYVHWVCPEMRGQLSIPDLHIPRRLKRTVRHAPYDVRINTAFRDVVKGCAESTQARPETWINGGIAAVFDALHESGYAHSVECWLGGTLVGGLYGLAIGGAFFGESMFSRARDASKIALVHLAARLWKGGFSLLDTQFINDHLRQFGAYEVPHELYKEQLDHALTLKGDFLLRGEDETARVRAYMDRAR